MPARLGLLLRYHVHLLTVLSLLFILQSGLVPFDFDFAGSTVHHFEVSTSPLTFPDVVANLFLYVPLGMFLHWSVTRVIRSGALSFALTVAICGLVSGSIEWVQAYSPSRVSSLIDLVTNSTGAALGACLSSAGRWLMPRLIGAALFEFKGRPAVATLKAYCGLLIVVAAIPFSFSFDAARLGTAVKASVFIPFGLSMEQRALKEQGELGGDQGALSLLRWERLRRWARWAAEAASFVVCAWLLQVVLRDDYGFNPRASTALTWWLFGLFAVALSGLQLPIVSRGCDVTDILFRWLGIGIGLATRSLVFRDAPQRRTEGMIRAARIAVVGYIVYTGMLPFEFARPRDGVFAPMSATAFLPFMAYFETRFDLMMTDVLEKFTAYGLLAASIAVYSQRLSPTPLGSRVLRGTVTGVALSSIIEVVQMFLPIRVVSLTDPIVAAAGCIAGAVLADHAVRFVHYAHAAEALGPDEVPVDPHRAPALGLTDQLIATLTEPHPGAPSEPIPAPQPKGL